MKKLKSLLLLLVIAALVVSTFACGGNSSNDKGDKVSNNGTGSLDLSNAKWKGKSISFSFGDTDENFTKMWADGTYDLQWQRGMIPEYRKEFENATGATVVNRPIPAGEDYTKKIVTEISAGMGPDIIMEWASAKPSFMVKNLVVPLSDYIDFTKPVYQDDKYISKYINELFTWGGKVYGMNKPMPACVLWYNKDKFATAGLEDPLDLWKQGKWDWNKFWEVGTALTQDTNGDGNMEQWAFCSWKFSDAFIYSNGVNYVTYDDTGMPRFALDDKYINAQQAANDAVNKYKVVPSVWWDPNPQERFMNGETCMDYWLTNQVKDAKAKMGADKVGIVPMAKGPDLAADVKSRDAAETLGWMITTSSKNPDLAALYLEWMMLDEKGVADRKSRLINDYYGSEDMYNLAAEWNAAAVQLDFSGFGQGFADAINLINNKPADKSWSQAIQENTAACQAALDDAIVNMK